MFLVTSNMDGQEAALRNLAEQFWFGSRPRFFPGFRGHDEMGCFVVWIFPPVFHYTKKKNIHEYDIYDGDYKVASSRKWRSNNEMYKNR
jgi:hypothetical protein